jgi:UDP-N-acetylenolpyruvoylglucosamine reductase
MTDILQRTPMRAAESKRSPGHMAAMDDTDRQIVEALRADGRMSMRALAELVHISRASAYTRVSRLEREGVITGCVGGLPVMCAGTAAWLADHCLGAEPLAMR